MVNSVETSNNNNIVVIDMVDGDATNMSAPTAAISDEQTANGVKEKMCLVDIPMPGKRRRRPHTYAFGDNINAIAIYRRLTSIS